MVSHTQTLPTAGKNKDDRHSVPIVRYPSWLIRGMKQTNKFHKGLSVINKNFEFLILTWLYFVNLFTEDLSAINYTHVKLLKHDTRTKSKNHLSPSMTRKQYIMSPWQLSNIHHIIILLLLFFSFSKLRGHGSYRPPLIPSLIPASL
jgi:hypothetical protein